MHKKYKKLDFEIVEFDTEDVITESPGNDIGAENPGDDFDEP